MLKVIVIDDEQWSLDYMTGLVDWNKHGAEIVATFNNALDALSFLTANSDIDLVFVDVEMPEMTGLEFLKRAGELSKNTSFVIISGYDIFGYAQQALRNGAKDYLLKPVEQTDVIRIIADTVGRCAENAKADMAKSNIAALSVSDSHKLIEQIWNIFDGECVACCVTDAPDIEISSILTPCTDKKYDLRCYHSVWHHAFFIKAPSDSIDELVKAKKSEKKYRFGFYITDREFESINDMLVKAKGAYEGIFFSSESNVFVYDNDHEVWSANYIFTAKRFLEERQIASVHSCIDEFYGELEAKSIQADTGVLFYNKLIDFLTRTVYSSENRSEHFIIDIQHAKKKFESKDELILFLHCLCDERSMEFNGEIYSSKAKDFIPRIQKYINENCQNELNLSVLAKEFMISGKYLSSVFKKTTGMNLNRYINAVRVKKAAAMLEQTEISIQDVSYLCGYNDCSYFTKIFKQLIGLTPSEYRISKQGFPID